jgi:hypothetical protein
MSLHTIPRASDRRSLGLTIHGRVHTVRFPCDLIDISEGGCKIRSYAGFAQPGDRVTLRIGGINAPLGIVAWIDGPIAGLAYEGEMHAAVIDYLIRQNVTHCTPDDACQGSRPI